MSPPLYNLFAFLRARAPGGIALAFSGGTDSALLLSALAHLYREAPFPLTALVMQSPLQFPEETQEARAQAERLQVPCEVCTIDTLALEQVRHNPPDRCYWCKRHFFSVFSQKAAAAGLNTLMDGTNADDLRSYRPGLRALREYGVVSPLAELGFSKQEVRALARELAVPVWNRPSAPCLATRLPYGTELTPELLGRIAKAETFVQGLLPAETPVRVRVHEQTSLVRIETAPEAIPALLAARPQLLETLHALGFTYLTLDLDGFRSGSMDGARGA